MDNVIDVTLYKATKVPLPTLRFWGPRATVGIMAVVGYCDYSVKLEANGLNKMIIRRGIDVPGWAEHDFNTTEKVCNTARFNQLTAYQH